MLIFVWALLLLGHLSAGQLFCSSRVNRTSLLFSCNETTSQTLTISREHLNLEFRNGPVSGFSNELHSTLNLDSWFSHSPPFAPTSSKNEQCRAHSEIFLKELRDMKLWALQMHDASAKAGSGLLNGNIVLLGDYDQCIAVDRTPSGKDGAHITGKYCVATVYIEAMVKPRTNTWGLASDKRRLLHHIIDLMQSHGAMRNDYEDDMRFLPTFNPISWAFCVPASCGTEDLEYSLTELLRPFNLTSGVDLKVVVNPGACEDKNSNPVDMAAVGTALFVAGIILFAVLGTFYERANTDPATGQIHMTATEGTLGRVLVAFSFRKNMRALLDTDVPEDELSCVHGLRAIASFFIYTIHRSVFAMFYPFTNRTQVAELLEGDWTMLFRAFWNWVDSFVILSGLLTSFYAFKRLRAGKNLNIPRMYLQRYIKFTPMLFVLALMAQNLLQHMATGPQRIRVLDHYVKNCKRGLWPVVSYTNVFEGFENMCYPPSHQLATDMHMYLMSPFFILLVWKFPRGGPAALGALLGVLAVLKYFVVLEHNLGSFLYYGVSIKQMVVSANYIYINAVHRLTPYLFGLGLGYILNISSARNALSRVQISAVSALALFSAVYSFYGVAHVSRRDYVYEVKEAAAFAVVQPLLWGFAMCWLIFCCATKHAPTWLLNFLKWRGFVVFSRLSYAIYLVQIYIIAVGVGGVMTSEYFRITKMVDLNEISAVCIASLLCTLLFLLPLQDLWNIAAGTYKPPLYAKNRFAEKITEVSLEPCEGKQVCEE